MTERAKMFWCDECACHHTPESDRVIHAAPPPAEPAREARFKAETDGPEYHGDGAGATPAPTADLCKQLRDTPNWLRQDFGNWKDRTSHYDRAPFEAADALEAMQAENARLRADRNEERAIVDRCWDCFGPPSYESLNGRSLIDLISDAISDKQTATVRAEAAEARARELEQDAGRYRWLRLATTVQLRAWNIVPDVMLGRDQLDGAIDAARKEGER